MQVAQQGCDAIIVVNAGSLGHGRKIGDHGRYAVLAATLEKSYQVSHQVISAIARSSPSCLG